MIHKHLTESPECTYLLDSHSDMWVRIGDMAYKFERTTGDLSHSFREYGRKPWSPR